MKPRAWIALAAVGALAGLGLGLLVGWVISPVQYVDTEPQSLAAPYRTNYVLWIARAYAETGDLPRAQVRLAFLGHANPAQSVAALAQQFAAAGQSPDDVQALLGLAGALGVGPNEVAEAPTARATTPPRPSSTLTPTRRSPTPTSLPATEPSTPSPTPSPSATNSPVPTSSPSVQPTRTRTRTPSPSATQRPAGSPTRTPTPRPTLTPTQTPIPVRLFKLQDQDKVCRPELDPPLIQVQVSDANGRPVPGVEIRVTWDGGEDHFFTGLKPELGLGYADFEMTAGMIYSLELAGGTEMIDGIQAEACASSSGEYPGSWLFEFSNQ